MIPGMRRMFLRKAIGLLAVPFVTQPRRGGLEDDGPTLYGSSRPVGVPVDSNNDYQAKENACKSFYEKRDALYREERNRRISFYDQDPDLLVLRSTSQSWRAGVMRDRIAARRSVEEKIQEKIDAIWKAPFESLKTLLSGWVNES